jgi:hypothetical protein
MRTAREAAIAATAKATEAPPAISAARRMARGMDEASTISAVLQFAGRL